MKIFISFLVLMLCTNLMYCQEPCNDDDIMHVKGRWVKRPDNNMKAANLPLINQRIDKMQQLLQQAYPELNGMEARWYRTMGGSHSAINKNLTEYELISKFYIWYCNMYSKKLSLGTEASTSFGIWVNKLKWFAEKDENFFVEDKPVFMLLKKQGEMNGFPLYGLDNSTSNTGKYFSKAMLISRPGQLPFTPINRRQYLIAFLKGREAMHTLQMEGYVKMVVRVMRLRKKFTKGSKWKELLVKKQMNK